MSEGLLLHVCCGPCASATYDYWTNQGMKVQGFFFNPNIHPFVEYGLRLQGAREMAAHTGMTLHEDLDYDPARWFAEIVPGEGARCKRCIAARLEATAREAAARGCEAFSTTLSISPWQDHEAIQSGGQLAAARHGVEFLYRDLRGLYNESRRLSKEWGLYRQKYCGCLLSEWERYREV